MVLKTTLFGNTTFIWATCCQMFFILCRFDTLIWITIWPFTWSGNRAHMGLWPVDREWSFLLIPDIFRGVCLNILWFVFLSGLMGLITVRYLCHFILNMEKFYIWPLKCVISCIFKIQFHYNQILDSLLYKCVYVWGSTIILTRIHTFN